MTARGGDEGAPVRFGVLGLGGMAHTMARTITATPGAELVAVASRDGDRARAFAEGHGVRRSFGTYAGLADCDEVDVAYIATPPSLHVEHGLLCLDGGKHVLCEKPFALTGDGARRMAAVAAARNLFLMEAMWTRFLPAVERLHQLVDDGAIGTPRMLVAGGAFQPEIDPDYYLFDPALGGGAMRDAGVYLLHLAHWCMGGATDVAAIDVKGETGVDVQDGVLLSHSQGGLSVLHLSMCANQPPSLDLLGDQGRLSLGPPVFNPSRLELTPRDGQPRSWEFQSDESGYEFQIAEVVACIRSKLVESPRLTLATTIAVTDILERISPWTGLAHDGV